MGTSFLLHDSPETIDCSIGPSTPFASDYDSVPRQTFRDFFSGIDVPRGYLDRYMTIPWGLNIHCSERWDLEVHVEQKGQADALSVHVRGSTFLPNIPPNAIVTINGYHAGTLSAKVRMFAGSR